MIVADLSTNQLVEMVDVMVELDVDSEEVDLRKAGEEKIGKETSTITKAAVRLQ